MSTWRLSIRLFGNAPDGRRSPVVLTHMLDELESVAPLFDLAAREGEIIYAFIEPMPGWLQRVSEQPSSKQN